MEFDPLQSFASLPIRFLLATLALSGMAWVDWRRNKTRATRYKEYLFLFASALIAIGFAEVHDAVTVRISPGYFAEGKGLGWSDLHWNVAKLAIKASYWVGLLLGLLYLVANNPFRDWPRIPYTVLFRFVAFPISGALLSAPIFGLWFRVNTPDLAPDFAFVWGIHNGTYFGAGIGALVAVCQILRRRIQMRNSLHERN